MQIPKLSEAEKKQLRLQIEAEIYRRSFYEFFVAASHILYPQVDWQYPPFYQYICELLQEATERNIRKEEKQKDFIFNLPFRAGKSILLSQIFPVWCWIKDNTLSIMQVSHSETLAIKHSHASKMLLESEWFKARFPEITLRVDTHAKSNFMNNFGGKRTSFGVQSGIIGEGANIQIIDDINNPKDSQAVTQTINEIYTDTLYSRLNNPATDFRIILQQRISATDICAYLLDSNPHKYMHVCLPVRVAQNISPPECIEFYKHGLLWEDRFTEKVIQDFQSTLGSRAFAGQLMQKPVAEEGNIIKRAWIKSITLDELMKLTNNLQGIEWNLYCDTAYTKKQAGDATAVICAGKFNNSVYILKGWKFWLEFPDLIKKLKEIKEQFKIRIVYVETKASGLSIIQQLRADGFDVGELKADTDKVGRMNAISSIVEGGRVYVVENNGWSTDLLVSELANFPFGTDDLADAFSYTIRNLISAGNFNYSMI